MVSSKSPKRSLAESSPPTVKGRTTGGIFARSAIHCDARSLWYAARIAERAKIHPVVLPFTVGGDDSAKDLFGLFDDTIQRLQKGSQ